MVPLVNLEHGKLPHVLPLAVHLDLGHLPDAQGCLGLLIGTRTPTQVGVVVVVVVSHEISVTAHWPNSSFPFGKLVLWVLELIGTCLELGIGTGHDNSSRGIVFIF